MHGVLRVFPVFIFWGEKKDSVIIIKEVSRYTNEELVLKKRLACDMGAC